MQPGSDREDSGRWALPVLLVVTSLAPAPGAALPGLAYYFRDFSLTFYPQKLFFARQLLAGRWPFWNPFVYEGSALLPFYYPLDLLHVLDPGPAFVSWLVTLHFPIAALAMYALARDLGACRLGAFLAGALYAMGGLALACLNLYIFLQALALAPLTVLLLRRAAAGRPRAVPLAALIIGVSLSTLAVEFVAQAVGLGLGLAVVALPRGRGVPRAAAAVLLGLAVAGAPVLITAGVLGESLRGSGVSALEALQRSVHPVALLQLFIADILGPPSEPLRYRWWARLLTDGAPYFTTLYLGPVALALAVPGMMRLRRPESLVLVGAALLALWYSVGWHSWLAPALVEYARFFRFPAKAMLTPHLVVSLLAGLGLSRLRAGDGWGGTRAAAILILVPCLAIAGGVVLHSKDIAAALVLDATQAEALTRLVSSSALWSACLAGVVALAGWAAAHRLVSRPAALLVALVALVDLVRAGSGVNPQAPPAFYSLLPEVRERLAALRPGRVFSFGEDGGPTMDSLLESRAPGLHRTSFHLTRQLLLPFANMLDDVEAAYGLDRGGFIPHPSLVRRTDQAPGAVAHVLPALRNAAVSRVVTLDELQHPELDLRASVPTGVPGVEIRVYELAATWPRDYVACRVVHATDPAQARDGVLQEGYDPGRDVVLQEPVPAPACQEGRVVARRVLPGDQEYVVELDGDGFLVMRDSFTPSWRATVDGRSAPVLRANGRHRAVPVASGRHQVRLSYSPPLLVPGLLSSGAGLSLCGLLLLRRRVSPESAAGACDRG